MNSLTQPIGHRLAIFGLLFALLFAANTQAAIDGVTGNTFNIAVKPAIIPTPDGDSLLIWGYSVNGGLAQYPGPTLIVNQGDTVTINLTNELSVPGMPVSMVFPGQERVSASGGSAGAMTQESSGATDTVTYTFTASHAGTYQYYSGTRPALQIEMGMVGALIVRPPNPKQAYADPDTAFDHEYLFLESEMAPEIHHLASLGLFDLIEQKQNTFNRVLWFFNGRNGPDTMASPGVSWLPNQPYNCLPRTHVGEKVLLRVIGAGQDLHPLHTHGNNLDIIAQDGRMLQSAPGAGADLARSDYTIQTVPGSTYDAIWTWTGKGLGWDIYGHTSNSDPLAPNEDPDSHGKPFPVVLPGQQELTFGGFYHGSPYLGQFGDLPPGEGGLNLNGGMFFMWHSHTERELVNNDIFPGGMMTMMIVEPDGVPIP